MTKAKDHKYLGKTGIWHISRNPKPIPDRSFDWDFYHEDYDGAPEETNGPPADNRCGNGKNISACIDRIKDLEEE
jgi:hypothetical protein